jgi:small subunit ribosomal protein S4
MIHGPKYKIARRLGAPVFEKTQTQKFVLRESNRKLSKSSKKPKAKSDFGNRLNEKQKARMVYGVNERQFSNYVNKAIATKGNSTDLLLRALESRLDNVAFRLGLANTRIFGRQMVSHGHLLVNGTKITIPSYALSLGDKITIRNGSKAKPIFAKLNERLVTTTTPAWIKADLVKQEWEIVGAPKLTQADVMFDVASVFEFYSR